MPTLFKVLNPFSFGELPKRLTEGKLPEASIKKLMEKLTEKLIKKELTEEKLAEELIKKLTEKLIKQSTDELATQYNLTPDATSYIKLKLKAFESEYRHAKTHAHKKNLKIARDHFWDTIQKYMKATITKKSFEENSDFITKIHADNQKISIETIETHEKNLETIRKNYFSSSAYFPVDLDENLSYRMSDAVIEAIVIISFLAIAGGIALFIATNIPATLILGFAASMAFIVTAGYSSLSTNYNTKSIEKREKALFQEIDKQCRKTPETTYNLDIEDDLPLDDDMTSSNPLIFSR